jgi:hypothetical protein
MLMRDSTKSETCDRGSNILDDIGIARTERIQRRPLGPSKFTKKGPQVGVLAEAFELAFSPRKIHVDGVVQMAPRISGPSLADKRTVDEGKPTRMVAFIFVGDLLEDPYFKLCGNGLHVFPSHLDEPVCWVKRCRPGPDMMSRSYWIHKTLTRGYTEYPATIRSAPSRDPNVAGSKMVPAIGDQDANANTRSIIGL